MSPSFRIVAAAAALLLGLWMLFFQDHFQAWARRRHEARLADRLARGGDAYFEELREIRAYPPERVPPFQRKAGGALFVIAGVSILAFSLTR